jgi:hypothetical protein
MCSLGIGYFSPMELSPTSASAPFRLAFIRIPRKLESRRADSNRLPLLITIWLAHVLVCPSASRNQGYLGGLL